MPNTETIESTPETLTSNLEALTSNEGFTAALESDFLLIEDSSAVDGSASRASQQRAGGVVAVRIFFEVQGRGSFTANIFDTARGDTNAWLKPGLPLNLNAKPGPGASFLGWSLNGNFAGAEPNLRSRVTRGLKIRAEFGQTAARSSGRRAGGTKDWDLQGSSINTFNVLPGSDTVTFSNFAQSKSSVKCFIDDFFVGGASPGDSLTKSCQGKSEVAVELVDAEESATGRWKFS